MSSDPRVVKSRQPKAYTDQQLAYLKGHLPEYERRSQGSIRGDSKKYAFERATEYIQRFGLPSEFITVEDGEHRFKEQIYNWFKNTVGRNRRKAEGRTRSSSKKNHTADEKGAVNGSGLTSGMSWNTAPATSNLAPYPQHAAAPIDSSGAGSVASTSTSPTVPGSSQLLSPMQYSPVHPPGVPSSSIPGGSNPPPSTASGNHTAAHTAAHCNTPHNTTTHPMAHSTPITIPNPANLMVTQTTLREAFLTLDAASISNMIQSFVAAHPSLTPLTPVVEALFEASIAESPRDPQNLVRRYAEVSTYLPSTILHAGYSGGLAAARALQMQIRRNSFWVPSAPPPGSMAAVRYQQHHHHAMSPNHHLAGHHHQHHHQHLQQQHPSSASSTPIPPGGGNAPGTPSVAANSLSEDMQRIANERQRRKDHIQWARIHAASLELGLMNNLGRMTEGDGYSISTGRAFSEMVARDAVWETDEAEWVAGIFVLRAVIRTASRGDRRQREDYNEMLMQYESRWKEIKDEMRQTMVTEVLLSSREELARLEEPMS